MRNNSFRLSPSDLHFMQSSTSSFPSISSSATLSSTRSDAQSAPPELTLLFQDICQNSAELLRLRGRELPPEWNIADLVQAVMGDEAFLIPGHLQDTYYDVLLRGGSSWLVEDLFHFLDLINYVL
ncbi:hypothetical protein RND71_008006 [Anisodus tanguticus]|uniref:Uncharacterized protein n=1 Tax=Anisodus tanguticus TaxID=243964 RepID=A0AAE1UU52_9SOLA|nr:hypothetical protein RND71_043792 [Anisodus tanguticus]KAK4372622.1 hypothetical protein RND71_008006 [Anisodus tanguticus]